MQLKPSRLFASAVLVGALAATGGGAHAEVVAFDLGSSYFHEALPYGHMQVYNPSTGLAAKPFDFLAVRAGWQADIVSGASIKTRNATRGQSPDAVSSASVKDFRQQVNGGFSLNRKLTSIDAGYSYSWENDYRSHSVDVTAKAELLEKSMELTMSYARNWDSVCDEVQTNPDPTTHRSLPTHDGCFLHTNPTVTTRPIAIDAIQAGWTQAWTPTFTTQTTFSIQMMNGFLSNPYREVNIGIAVPVQEHIPGTRTRLALGVRGNWWLKALKTALRLSARGYRDTWDIRAFNVELELEKYVILDALRLRLRGRYYDQSHAGFYSDDYLITPRGEFFTGDRELSQMHSFLFGARLLFSPTAAEKRVLGIMEKLEISLGGDLAFFRYSDFTINGAPLQKTAILASLAFSFYF